MPVGGLRSLDFNGEKALSRAESGAKEAARYRSRLPRGKLPPRHRRAA